MAQVIIPQQCPLNVIYIRVLRGHCSIYSMGAGKYLLCSRSHTWFLLNSRKRLFPLNPSKNLASVNNVCIVYIIIDRLYTVKKGQRLSRPQPECHTPHSPWPRIIKFLPPGRVWSVTSQLGTGKSQTFFTMQLY
jgi:hypothetical protein